MNTAEGPRPAQGHCPCQTSPWASYRPVAEGRDDRLIHGSLDAPTGYTKGPLAGISAIRGPFSTWWQVKDSNLRGFRVGFTDHRPHARDQRQCLSPNTSGRIPNRQPTSTDDSRSQPDTT